MTPSVIPFWNRLTKCNNILKEKVKKNLIGKIFFLDFTSDSAKSNLANVGGILARIKNFFSQRWFLIGSSIRFQTGVTFEENFILSLRPTLFYLIMFHKYKRLERELTSDWLITLMLTKVCL